MFPGCHQQMLTDALTWQDFSCCNIRLNNTVHRLTAVQSANSPFLIFRSLLISVFQMCFLSNAIVATPGHLLHLSSHVGDLLPGRRNRRLPLDGAIVFCPLIGWNYGGRYYIFCLMYYFEIGNLQSLLRSSFGFLTHLRLMPIEWAIIKTFN